MVPVDLSHSPQNAALLRVGCFVGVFLAMSLWELGWPRRPRTVSRGARWPGNLGIAVLNAVVTRFASPLGAVGFAAFAESHPWGILKQTSLSEPWISLATILILDLAIYLQHRLFHAVPLLWKLHRMHHADVDLDVTSGARFHPAEILLSLAVKWAAIVLIGASAWGVFLFEVILNASAMFNHSNVRIPLQLDQILRWLIVTPDMHRVHHSVELEETESNFGFNLPWWDRLFRTYRDQPKAGQDRMVIGLHEFREPSESKLSSLLTQPFRKP